MRILGLALLPLAATLASPQTPEFTGPVTLGWQAPLGAADDFVSVYSIALSPDADMVYTCGTISLAAGGNFLQATAIHADSGSIRWTTNVTISGLSSWGGAIAVAPDGSRVYVSGAHVATIWEDALVASLDSSTGEVDWTRTWDGSYGWDDWAGDLAVTPDGGRVYVTGTTTSSPLGDYDALILALDAITGGVLWSRAWDASGRSDFGAGVGISPDGATVFVAGTANTGEVCDTSGCTTETDVVVLAYAAADGAPLWSSVLNTTAGPASTDLVEDHALGLAVHAEAGRVVVGGWSSPVSQTSAVGLAAAFAMGDGAELWRNTVSAPGVVTFEATAFDLHAETGVAYLVGKAWLNDPPGLQSDVGAVALDAGNGGVLWATTHGAAGKDDWPRALAVRTDGAELAVAGRFDEESGLYDSDLGAIGLDASSGALRWTASLDGTKQPTSNDDAFSIVAAPDARRWFVGGQLTQDNAPPGVVLALDRPLLWGDPPGLSVSAGGVHDLQIDAGPEHANHLYLVVGSLAGTDPGIPVPPFVVPLNWDVYLEYSLANPNSPFLPNTLGGIGPDGTAVAALLLPASAPPSLVGQVAHHACVVFDVLAGFELVLASNPTSLELLP